MRTSSFLFVTVLGLAFVGCSDDGESGDTGPVADARRQLLSVFASDVLSPRLAEFATDAGALESAAAAWAATPEDATALANAREAFGTVMDTWQELEVLQVGPAGQPGDIEGGQGLRDEIYSWPTANACRVDQETIEDAAATPAGLRPELVNVRGLDALERLLFAEDETNACPSSSPLNLDGTWDDVAETPGAITARRATYAASAATLVRERAETLRDAWSGGFATELATAGAGSTVYGSSNDALNSVSDALFYLEGVSLNMKLAEPLGLSGCEDAEVCPEERESLFANRSIANFQANYATYVDAYRGGSGYGFDDLLREVGATDLADRTDAAIAAATPAVEALEGTLPEILAGDTTELVRVNDLVTDVVRLQRTELVSVFNLRLPQAVAADND
ncbi:MAG: imelysin family protein [Myxococcota bacterium]